MDTRTIQPAIDTLNAEIARLVSARDTLQAVLNGSGQPKPTAQRKKPTESARSLAQRKRWAEQKRQQRAARVAAKKAAK